jgi:hypothetical protein
MRLIWYLFNAIVLLPLLLVTWILLFWLTPETPVNNSKGTIQ